MNGLCVEWYERKESVIAKRRKKNVLRRLWVKIRKIMNNNSLYCWI